MHRILSCCDNSPETTQIWIRCHQCRSNTWAKAVSQSAGKASRRDGRHCTVRRSKGTRRLEGRTAEVDLDLKGRVAIHVQAHNGAQFTCVGCGVCAIHGRERQRGCKQGLHTAQPDDCQQASPAGNARPGHCVASL